MKNSLIFKLIDLEQKRQINGLEMIPSENYVSSDVLKALGSVLTNKYSEGFPGARYYGGNEYIDKIETYTRDLANKLFKTKHAIVQPYSGSPANLAVDLSLAKPGDTIMGMELSSGGHLTHGAPVSFTGKLFKSIQYGVGKDGRIDLDEVKRLAKEHKPKLIWVGLTAYPFRLDFAGFSKIANKVNAYLVADISHIAGLIITGIHPSPAPYVDVITTTTHKTLRGPRGAMILATEKGLKKDPEIISKLERAIFPGLQGGPHNNVTAAIAIALEEASKPSFKKYIQQVLNNAQVLAKELDTKTENHLILWDLSKFGFGLGYQMQIALELAGMTANKQSLPLADAKGKNTSPWYPSGIRLGTPALTSRGMKEGEMAKISRWMKLVLAEVAGYDLPQNQEERKEFIKNFKKKMQSNKNLKKIKSEIKDFSKKYSVPGIV